MQRARRSARRALGLAGASLLLLTACSQGAQEPEAAFGPCGNTYDELVAAAKAEGQLNMVGTPLDWAGYDAIITRFQETYGITVNSVLPELDSFEELTILRTWRGDPRYPDVADVSLAAMAIAIDEGLIAPYRPPSAEQNLASFRDPKGYWVSPYAGFITFGVNSGATAAAPTSWADLTKSEYRDAVALRGDPATSGVGTATLSAAALANGGSLEDLGPGFDYFAELWESGNLRNGIALVNDLRYATAPIMIDWSYNIDAANEDIVTEKDRYRLVFPSDGQYGMGYVNGLPVGAPHPCAGMLWIDYLQSPEVGLIRLEAGAVPPSADRLRDDPSLTDEQRAMLPPAEALDAIVFPTAEQADAVAAQITGRWKSTVPGWKAS